MGKDKPVKKKKKKSSNKVGYEAARIVALAVFLACAGIIGDKIYGYIHDDESELAWREQNQLEIGVTPKPAEKTAPPYPEVTPERITYPQIIAPEEVKRLEGYDDFVSWLHIDMSTEKNEDKSISNYVVQAADNDFYLRKNIDKETNGNGSLFMDYRCDPETWQRHNIIYGHNQKNGTMFSDLREFNDPTFFKDHPLFYTYSSKGVKIWKIFSAYETDTSDYYIETWFENDETYYDFIRNLQSKSIAETDVVLKATDKVLTLSTCYKYTNPNGRYVVHAVLIGEAPLA